MLSGDTDSKGSDVHNLSVSKERAESVKAYWVIKGSNSSRIEAKVYGESQPISTNNTDAGRQKTHVLSLVYIKIKNVLKGTGFLKRMACFVL